MAGVDNVLALTAKFTMQATTLPVKIAVALLVKVAHPELVILIPDLGLVKQ